jgi:3-deoxy-manno-octulosonate cytidylyltransferase (CMP-KDO synthetase)
MKIIAVIPARYASSRFPGKPLVAIDGISMIQRVYTQAQKVAEFSKIIVATDDERIYEHVLSFGGAAMLTASSHQSGTDRIGEVINKANLQADIVVNIQGDEPFIQPEQLKLLLSAFENKETSIATLIKHIENQEELLNPNVVKVTFTNDNNALYFSRSVIPFNRNTTTHYYKHIGIYAYKTDTLKKLIHLAPTALEKAESLEQLRWLENGYAIRLVTTTVDAFGIDTPEDLEKAIAQ